jgi:hypothetical protein
MVVANGRLSFKLVIKKEQVAKVTAYAGLPLVVETVLAVAKRKHWKQLARALGYERWQTVYRHVLTVLALQVSGGETLSDAEALRADGALAELIGFEASSPTQLKDFLYRFHQREDGSPLSEDDDAALTVAGRAQIRPEGPALRALEGFSRRFVETLQKHSPCFRATLDVDATVIEANKQQALHSYEGPRGYQPQMAWWAEQQAWVCDEFRDGNVPAEFEARVFLQRAFAALPASVRDRRLRGDAALYSEQALTWADDQGIRFAVSADMSESLAGKIQALPERAWQPYRHGKASEEREWAEVEFVPDWPLNYRKHGRPLRYLAIRVRSLQRDLLLADEARWKHFAVVTNMDWDGARLLRWHREKQGTVEDGHDLLKNELAGGVLPCGRFCANAAWWRLTALCSNVLRLLKVVALPEAFHPLRPKALRFRLFNLAGRLLRHGRQLWLRIREVLPSAKTYAQARKLLLKLEPAGP